MRRDRDPETIKAEIRRRGQTLSSLARGNGLPRQAVSLALIRPYAEAEAVIAAFLRCPAHRIWPSRYNSSGERKHPQPRANYRTRARFPRSRNEGRI